MVACMLLVALATLLVRRRKTYQRLQAAMRFARETEARYRELSETTQAIALRNAPVRGVRDTNYRPFKSHI